MLAAVVVSVLWFRRRRAAYPLNETLLLRSTQDGVPAEVYESATVVRKLGRGSTGRVWLLRVKERGEGEGEAGGEPETSGALIVCKSLAYDDFDSSQNNAPNDTAQTARSVPPSQFGEAGTDVLYEMYHEVRVLSQMTHPNIIRYLHASRDEGELKIYMEYAEGGTLAQAVTARGARLFESAQVQRWTRQLAAALQHVHAQGVLHRDVKAANVLLTRNGVIKLGDFGSSRALSTHTHFAQTMVGTPYYLAPEVLRGEPYSFAADVWGAGVVLFELLTLRRPFEGVHLGALLIKVERGEYDHGALAACTHPTELKRLASHECLLHPDPSERMRLDELLEALPADGGAE